MADKIVARFIIEIAGKPAENVDRALNVVLEKMNEKTDKFKVLDSHIEEAELDEKTTLYNGFLEVSVKFENYSELLGFIIDYTPTSVEVEEPEKISMDNNSLTELLNDVSNNLLRTNNRIRQLNAHIHMLNKKFGINKK